MSREGKLVKNTLILSIGTFLPKLASFVTLPILTAYLTKEEYGTYDLITVLVSLLLPAVTLQIQTAAFRFLIDKRNDESEIKSIVSTIFAFILPVSLVSLVILWFVLPLEHQMVKAFICGYFLIDIIVNSTRQISRGLQRNMEYSISAIISAFGKMIFAVIFVWQMQLGLLGAAISLFLASLLSWIVLSYRIRLFDYIRISSVSTKQLKSLLSYSWPMVPNSMSMWVMRLSDRLVVTAFMGLSWNAVYAVANKIPSLLNLAQISFTYAWQENASVVSKDEDADAYYSSMFRTMFDLMAGFLGLLICLTPVLFRIFVRGDYADSYGQMPVLFLAQFFYAMSTFLGGIYVAYMKTKSVGVTTVVAALCNLVIDLATIKWIGLYAASGSTLVSYLILFIYRLFDVQKIVKIRYDKAHLFLVVAALLVESILCYLRLPVIDIINVVIGALVFTVLNKTLIQQSLKLVLRKLKK